MIILELYNGENMKYYKLCPTCGKLQGSIIEGEAEITRYTRDRRLTLWGYKTVYSNYCCSYNNITTSGYQRYFIKPLPPGAEIIGVPDNIRGSI